MKGLGVLAFSMAAVAACFPGPLPLDADVADTVVTTTSTSTDATETADANDSAEVSGDTTAVAETDATPDVVPCPGGCDHLDGPCVRGVCADGSCIEQALSGGECDDGEVCTVDDTCDSGACVGVARVCADALACSEDACDEEAGGCVADTTPCACLEDADCGDDNLCNGVERCVDNQCVAGADVACEVPANACQENVCQPATGLCKLGAKVAGTECDDGDACTRVDACGEGANAGVCVGADRVVCFAANDCTGAGTCNPLSGVCSEPPLNDGTHCFDATPLAGEISRLGLCAAGQCRRLPHVVAEADTTCAIFHDGTLRCWGRNLDGGLGYGHKTPVGDGVGLMVAEAGTIAVPPVLAKAGTCVLNADGVRCWGDSSVTPPDTVPLLDVGIEVAALSSDGSNCLLTTTGGARCWGSGVLGYPGVTAVAIPGAPSIASVGDVQVAPIGESFVPVEISRSHATCARSAAGIVRCWGIGPLGILTSEAIGDDEHPSTAPVVNGQWSATDISVSTTHACAVAGGVVYCWGSNGDGQLGLGSTTPSAVPTTSASFGLGGPIKSVTCGRDHTCVLSATGGVKCFGQNFLSQLGLGHRDDMADEPTESVFFLPVLDVGGTVTQIDAGNDHTCAVLRNGEIRCWGYNGFGQLGVNHQTPVGGMAGEMPPEPVDFGF